VRPLEEVERDYILGALELNGGNRTHTAQQLHIGSATLYRKLKSYGHAPKPEPAAVSPVSPVSPLTSVAAL
jgi:two-component system response regulator HydG